MVEKDRFLVVVSVLEGRRFPKRPKHKLVAEAKFDGELLSTDPVDHVEGPDFTQELAWELDKKGLQQHRLQRTSVKVQVYACDTVSTMREAVGYVILDLRSAQSKQTSKWYPLLHCKYHKNKPELRLAIYLDEDKTEQASFKAREAPARVIDEVPDIETDPRFLQPTLNEEEGYYQIGPAGKCKDHFVLSVTIATAVNLPQLIPSTQALPANASGYFFYFSLLGNDVTNEVFHDLINPTFPAERASVRVRSSIDLLRMFFSKQPGIQVHLCCGDQSLGSTEIPLNTLLKKNSTEIYMKPVAVEGSFQLVPPNQVKQQIQSVQNDTAPSVGVSVVLRKEDMALRTPVKEPQGSVLDRSNLSPDRQPPLPQQHSPPEKLPKDIAKGKGGQKGALPEVPVAAERKEDQYSESFEETQDNVSSLEEDRRKQLDGTSGTKASTGQTSKPSADKAQRSPSQPQGAVPRVIPASDSSTTQQHLAIPPQSHHFTFSIDLRSVKDIESTHTVNVFLRYTYPFFGSAAPILTHPPVEIRKGMEVLLPQSFCAFDFACSMQQLQDTFLRVPLLVELWNRDKQLSKDVMLGAARLPLGEIITAEKTRVMNSAGGSGWRQVYSDRVPVMAGEGKLHKTADIAMVLSLEDWGPINTEQLVGAESSSTYGVAEAFGAKAMEDKEPRETSEYKAALELEMWKESQEEMFENQLKQKEMMYMKALAEEWKKRDKEREVLMKKKLGEYAQLEEQLRKTLLDLEKREKQLAANEQEVMRLRGDLQRQHDLKLQEMKEASRRMKEDCDHQVELERLKTKEMDGLLARYKQELSEGEKKYHALDKDFAIYKEQQNSKPEVRLQSEINLLTLEKVELERKLDAVSKSKVHYKQQWGRALKELARLKQKEQTAAKAQLQRQQQELEHMRLRYLAAEEKEVVQSEKKELEDIKNELNKLRQNEEKRSAEPSPREYEGMKPLQPDLNSSLDEHITRLIEERDTLLRTGVYSTQDKIIAELDRQIREAIGNKKGIY